MVSVITMVQFISISWTTWLIPHLIVNNSVSVDITLMI